MRRSERGRLARRPYRYIALLMPALMLLGACGRAEPQAQANETSLPTETWAEEESWFDVWDENYVSPASDDPMAICNLFPDPFFAWEIAQLFERTVTDTTTYEELAAYEGGIDCGPGLLKSVEGIGLLTGVTSFSSSKNELEALPAEIGNLVNLTEINLLKSYAFKRLPPEIGKLKKLTTLRADMTSLEALPPEIGDCEALEYLHVGNTAITSVPPEIGKLKKLRVLVLSSTGITSVPDSICELASLESLYIGHTGLTALPKDIGNLQNLHRLHLFGCKLKKLPKSMKNLKNLRHLNVYDNFQLDEEYKKWFDKKVYT